MEILISLIILSLVFLGLLNLFISGRRYIQHSQSRMTAAELGKLFIDPLQMEVRQNDWWWKTGDTITANRLIPTTVSGSAIELTESISSVTYRAVSTVEGTGLGDLRRVRTKIDWTDK